MLSLNNNKYFMKMFGSKSLSTFLYYGCTVITVASLSLISFILFSLALENFELINEQFKITIPLFPEMAIKGRYNDITITTITLFFIFYTIFFGLLTMIFKTFKASILFTDKAIKQLNYFTFLNLLVAPILYITINFIILVKDNYYDFASFLLHILLGIMALFIVAVFKKGYTIQSENDLTI